MPASDLDEALEILNETQFGNAANLSPVRALTLEKFGTKPT